MLESQRSSLNPFTRQQNRINVRLMQKVLLKEEARFLSFCVVFASANYHSYTAGGGERQKLLRNIVLLSHKRVAFFFLTSRVDFGTQSAATQRALAATNPLFLLPQSTRTRADQQDTFIFLPNFPFLMKTQGR